MSFIHLSWIFVYQAIGWLICISMIPVVLRRQLAPGASLAWLGIVFLHPYIGLVLYMMVGESRLGPRRAQAHRDIISKFRNPARHPDRKPNEIQPDSCEPYQPMVNQAEKISGLPVLTGNAVEFLTDTDRFVDALIADIAAAKKEVHLLYYIIADDAVAERVAAATIEAAKRGVKCRVLADAVASRKFFHANGLAPELRINGVDVAAALPVAPIRRRLARMDLRNHRKLAIIDGETAYAGSHNLINADYDGRRGNPWYDATARLSGPIVGELAMVFAEDWQFETGEEIKICSPDTLANAATDQRVSSIVAQAVPTGPSVPGATYRRLLLAAIQCSQKQLMITTPYFVPDETTITSLMMAADRGVEVTLILPQNPDHLFAAAAGRAHFQVLLESGVKIYLYQPGLIHAKTTTVDDAFTLFGSANLDVRSFVLNFELSLLMYGPEPTDRVRAIQNHYLSQSVPVELEQWKHRPIFKQYADRAISLLSPVL
jgi:cardiolipin synthase